MLVESEIDFFSLNHFNCICNSLTPNGENTHEDYLVSVCENHLIFLDISTQFCCSCCRLTGFENCQICVNIRGLLNFLAKKVCLKTVPDFLAGTLKPII